MPQTIVNLTLPIVVEKIDEILDAYPFYPHQQAFATPDLRQKLTAYVMSRMPVVYVTMDDTRACFLESPAGCYSYDQQEQVNRLIRQGIETLLSGDYDWRQRHLTEQPEATLAPSSWFG